MASAGNKKSGFSPASVVVAFVVLAVLGYAASLFLQGSFQGLQSQEYATKTYGPADETVLAHRAEQAAILNEKTRWVNKGEGTVCLPIGEAVDRFVVTHGSGVAE